MRCTLIDTSLFRRIELQLLMNITARAFGEPAPRIWTLSNDEALRLYAEYTRDHLRNNSMDERLLQRMNDEACKTGRLLRHVFLLKKQADIEQFIIGLYRNIDIELEGHIPGTLCFQHCFFSHYYTPETCLAASALDEGIMRGLTGRGRLSFRQRITEGCNKCIATYE